MSCYTHNNLQKHNECYPNGDEFNWFAHLNLQIRAMDRIHFFRLFLLLLFFFCVEVETFRYKIFSFFLHFSTMTLKRD